MTEHDAAQIAELLNNQNELVVPYNAERVRKDAGNYVMRRDGAGGVIACLELKKVQWYQFEISHVCVALRSQRNGHARALVHEAERSAVGRGARILQCTIRENNEPSKALFAKCGFVHVLSFYYPHSGNMVGVWQKVVSHAPK